MSQLSVTSGRGAIIKDDVDKCYLLQHSLQSRFRGALLGLVLSANASDVNNGLNHKTTAKPVLKHKISLWHLSLGLLRHHDDWMRRWQWITSAAQSGLTVVEALIVGDVLEQVLCGLLDHRPTFGCIDALGDRNRLDDRLSGLTHLENRLLRYDLPAEQQRYYRKVFADISADILPHTGQDAMTQGLLCGLQSPGSYGLSVQMAAQFGEVAILVAGLLSGAIGSQSALPVVWQLQYSATAEDSLADLAFQYLEVVAIADRLFNQWSGVLPD